MISALLLTLSAHAITRQEILDAALAFVEHEWTMADSNATADCSADYASDHTPGPQVGLPYAWGGFMDRDAFDARIAEGQGAGSHSWNGVLSCVAGLDCSGFVSQAWGLPQKYGTSGLSAVSETVSVDEILPGDAFNKAGSHVVLYVGTDAQGAPIFYEASGGASRVRIHSGWSYLSGYTPIRLTGVEDGVLVGTAAAPIAVDELPLTDLRRPAARGDDALPGFVCEADDGSAETETPTGAQILYSLAVAESSALSFSATGGSATPVLRLVPAGPDGAPDPAGCTARGDGVLEASVCAGDWFVSIEGDEMAALHVAASLTADASACPDAPALADVSEDITEDEAEPQSASESAAVEDDLDEGCSVGAAPLGAIWLIPALLVRRRRG